MHHRLHEKKNCHSREGGNPRIYDGERKVQLIIFTYLYGSRSEPIFYYGSGQVAHVELWTFLKLLKI